MNSTSSFERPAEFKLRQLLKELRISATIHQIPEWSESEEFVQNGSVLNLFTGNKDDFEHDEISDEDINRSKLYMQGYDFNEIPHSEFISLDLSFPISIAQNQ